MSPHTIHC